MNMNNGRYRVAVIDKDDCLWSSEFYYDTQESVRVELAVLLKNVQYVTEAMIYEYAENRSWMKIKYRVINQQLTEPLVVYHLVSLKVALCYLAWTILTILGLFGLVGLLSKL